MMKFQLFETPIKDLLLIKTKLFKDERGFFIESYNKKTFEMLGINANFIQDNQSLSKKGVLRGLHFQLRHPQGKLVRVISGRAFDVAVDLRANSHTFGKWFGIELSQKNGLQMYIPPGFAHGFLSLSDKTIFFYKCTEYYFPDDELGIIWNDTDLGIKWPLKTIRQLIISDKDKKLPVFQKVKSIILKGGEGTRE